MPKIHPGSKLPVQLADDDDDGDFQNKSFSWFRKLGNYPFHGNIGAPLPYFRWKLTIEFGGQPAKWIFSFTQYGWWWWWWCGSMLTKNEEKVLTIWCCRPSYCLPAKSAAPSTAWGWGSPSSLSSSSLASWSSSSWWLVLPRWSWSAQWRETRRPSSSGRRATRWWEAQTKYHWILKKKISEYIKKQRVNCLIL